MRVSKKLLVITSMYPQHNFRMSTSGMARPINLDFHRHFAAKNNHCPCSLISTKNGAIKGQRMSDGCLATRRHCMLRHVRIDYGLQQSQQSFSQWTLEQFTHGYRRPDPSPSKRLPRSHTYQRGKSQKAIQISWGGQSALPVMQFIIKITNLTTRNVPEQIQFG
jgi:hypothetical protein